MLLTQDTLGNVMQFLKSQDAHYIVMLSLVSRSFLKFVDNMDNEMCAPFLPVKWFDTATAHYCLRSSCLDRTHSYIDLSHWRSLQHHLLQKLSSPIESMKGKIIYMPLKLSTCNFDVQTWKVVEAYDFYPERLQRPSYTRSNGNVSTGRMLLHSLDVAGDDNQKQKSITLDHVMYSVKKVTRRELLVLHNIHNCMVCKTRPWSFVSPACPDRDMRKICQTCGHQIMVSPRNLMQTWLMPLQYMDEFWHLASHFSSVNCGTHAVWVAKSRIEERFKTTWFNFIKSTAKRRRFIRRF